MGKTSSDSWTWSRFPVEANYRGSADGGQVLVRVVDADYSESEDYVARYAIFRVRCTSREQEEHEKKKCRGKFHTILT